MKAILGYDNVAAHIDPWSQPIAGAKIFPDYKNPLDNVLRAKLQVVVKTSAALAGKTIFVKAFDVDDSTSEAFDTTDGAPVLDPNGKSGNDNFPDYLNTPQSGQFWTGTAWGTNTAQGIVDSKGQTTFDFRVGMQPGNNYRIVASAVDQSMITPVQVTSATADTYLGPELAQTGGSPASPLLTVWRRLWVENDSMASIPVDTLGFKRNDLTADLTSPAIQQVFAGIDLTTLYIPTISDRTSFNELQNGILKLPQTGLSFPVSNTITNLSPGVDAIQLTGNQSNIPANSLFRLYDDDDFGLNRAPLPRNDLIDDTFKNVYKPAFIEVVDAANFRGLDYNPNKTVAFHRNHPVMGGPWFPIDLQTPGVWDDAINLSDSKPRWVGNLVAGYQGNIGDDGDPSSEGLMEGVTPGSRRYSIVYVENVREQIDGVIRNSSTNNAAINSEIARNIKLTAAHEIGHMPGGGNEASHHSEEMLMDKDGYGSVNGLDFSPKSILRFRKTNQWQQP